MWVSCIICMWWNGCYQGLAYTWHQEQKGWEKKLHFCLSTCSISGLAKDFKEQSSGQKYKSLHVWWALVSVLLTSSANETWTASLTPDPPSALGPGHAPTWASEDSKEDKFVLSCKEPVIPKCLQTPSKLCVYLWRVKYSSPAVYHVLLVPNSTPPPDAALESRAGRNELHHPCA